MDGGSKKHQEGQGVIDRVIASILLDYLLLSAVCLSGVEWLLKKKTYFS